MAHTGQEITFRLAVRMGFFKLELHGSRTDTGAKKDQNDRHQKEENGNDDEKKGERVCIDKVYK